MESVERKIQRLIRHYVRMVGTHDPVAIAEYAGIGVAHVPLGNASGNYKLLKRKRWIFVNSDLDTNDPMHTVIIAHELGHAFLHRTENCSFIKNYTLLSTYGIEREANLFAAHLLITDDMLREYEGFTMDDFCRCTGYPMELIRLRINAE